ncbi:Leucine-rich repeat transmembrane neuronal protein 2 [Nymphon striatum]|nr:Leucine-rich repeat transmembrane neuronal protein 2 [Nymphon striatum]
MDYIPTETMKLLKKIQTFEFRNSEKVTSLSDKAFAGFAGYRSIERMLLSNNNIRSLGKFAFSDLLNLREIDLEGNKLETISLNSFPLNMANMKFLFLGSNEMTNFPFGVRFVEALPSRAIVSLTKNNLTTVRNKLNCGCSFTTIASANENYIRLFIGKCWKPRRIRGRLLQYLLYQDIPQYCTIDPQDNAAIEQYKAMHECAYCSVWRSKQECYGRYELRVTEKNLRPKTCPASLNLHVLSSPLHDRGIRLTPIFENSQEVYLLKRRGERWLDNSARLPKAICNVGKACVSVGNVRKGIYKALLLFFFKVKRTMSQRQIRSTIYTNGGRVIKYSIGKVGKTFVTFVTFVSPFASIRKHSQAFASIRKHSQAFASIRKHSQAFASIRMHSQKRLRLKMVDTPYSSNPVSEWTSVTESLEIVRMQKEARGRHVFYTFTIAQNRSGGRPGGKQQSTKMTPETIDSCNSSTGWFNSRQCVMCHLAEIIEGVIRRLLTGYDEKTAGRKKIYIFPILCGTTSKEMNLYLLICFHEAACMRLGRRDYEQRNEVRNRAESQVSDAHQIQICCNSCVAKIQGVLSKFSQHKTIPPPPLRLKPFVFVLKTAYTCTLSFKKSRTQNIRPLRCRVENEEDGHTLIATSFRNCKSDFQKALKHTKTESKINIKGCTRLRKSNGVDLNMVADVSYCSSYVVLCKDEDSIIDVS